MKGRFVELKRTFFIIWDGFWIIWIAQVFFVVCSLPVITIPAAYAGMNYTMSELARGESVDWKTFFSGVRQYFWAGYRWFLINLLVGGVLLVNIFFYLNPNNGLDPTFSQVISGIPVGLLIIWVLINFLTFPLMLVQENISYRQALRNSLVFYAKWPLFTLLFCLAAELIFGLSVWYMAPMFLFGASLPALLASIVIKIKTDKTPAP